jgi:hypothetical protein
VKRDAEEIKHGKLCSGRPLGSLALLLQIRAATDAPVASIARGHRTLLRYTLIVYLMPLTNAMSSRLNRGASSQNGE